MAVISDLTKVTVTAKLNNGTKEDGSVQTLSLSLGNLDIDTYDDQKAMNIIALLKPCLAKEVYETQKAQISVLSISE